MRVIVIEDCVYKVTEREYKVLDSMAENVKKSKDNDKERLDEELNEYLDVAKINYQKIGPVFFDWRR